nr:MAG TPA: hypothetical protein [Caudoviricetes sp.]
MNGKVPKITYISNKIVTPKLDWCSTFCGDECTESCCF